MRQVAVCCLQEGSFEEDAAMPQYVFLCEDCHKEFTESLHIADMEKGEVSCPHCGSKRVTQEVVTFSAVTSKKS
jgi:putative FmdB family regulatory protein